jgi:hypothetical protein
MSLTDKELYTEAMIASYRRLMDLAFWDPAAADEDGETEPEEEKEEDK